MGTAGNVRIAKFFFAADWLVGCQSLCHQKPIGRDTQGGVMVEAPPTASLVVIQPEVLLEVLVVAFDTPALVGGADESCGPARSISPVQ